MTYIKVESVHTEDERWLLAGADAFAVHIAALVYCDRHLTEGRISAGMAVRVSLAVPAERAEAAVAALVEHGFWTTLPTGSYQIERFEEHALTAKEITRTREKWKRDKDRQRQHRVGDHSLCTDPKFCPAIRSTVDSTVESTSGGTSGSTGPYQTQSDQTRPYRRYGSGNGSDGPARADAQPTRAYPQHHPFTGHGVCCELPREHPVHHQPAEETQ